jgi:hypothetical protein
MGNAYNNASLLVTPNGYKASKIYSAKPTDGSGDLAFSRASTAMRRNSAGLWESVANNVPRLQYPVGGGCPSWLFEPQATNNALHSTDFSNAVWAVAGTAAKAASALPSNIVGVTAYDITGLGAPSTDYFQQSVSGFLGVSFQVFIKATVIGDVGTTINLTSNNNIDINITLTDEWQEFSVYNASSNGSPKLSAGTGTKCTISYIGVVNSTTATSPIITAGSAVTRLADVTRLASASALIGQTEGTLFLEVLFNTSNDASSYLQITDGTFSNAVIIGKEIPSGAARYVFYVIANGITIFYNDSNNVLNSYAKIAIVYSSGRYAAFLNGVLVASGSTSFSFSSTLGTIGLGTNNSTASQTNATMLAKTAEIYKTALSDSEAIELTTL